MIGSASLAEPNDPEGVGPGDAACDGTGVGSLSKLLERAEVLIIVYYFHR
jgi:hypothetical protein